MPEQPHVPLAPMELKARRHHLRTQGQKHCPFCMGLIQPNTIEYGQLTPDPEGGIRQYARCLMCDRRWVDVFTLTDVHSLCSAGCHEID